MYTKGIEKKYDFEGYFWIIAYNISMLFYQHLNKFIVILLGISFLFWFIFKNKKKWDLYQMLSFLLCIYMPTSFVSILGTSYGELPLTWFNLSTIILFILIFIKKIRINYFLFAPILMIIYGLISFTRSIDLIDASKQLLTIILFLLSFIIGEFLSQYSDKIYNKKLKSYYLLSVFTFSITVIMQKFLVKSNFFVGYYTVVGNGREIYAGLLNDYSFATLYVATGAIILIVDYFDKQRINTFKFLIGISFLLIAMLYINSRTGLVALFVTVLIYLIWKIIKGHLKALFFMIPFLISIPIIAMDVVKNRGGQGLLDGSGRILLINRAFEVFLEHPFLGVGFGLNNLYMKTGMYVPHNLIAQYFAQFGLIGSGIFFSTLFVAFLKYYKFSNNYLWVLLTILIGTMLIPDIVSSRFLSVLVMITIITSTKKTKKQVIVREGMK